MTSSEDMGLFNKKNKEDEQKEPDESEIKHTHGSGSEDESSEIRTSDSDREAEKQSEEENTSKKVEAPIKASIQWEKKEDEQRSPGKRTRAGRSSKRRDERSMHSP